MEAEVRLFIRKCGQTWEKNKVPDRKGATFLNDTISIAEHLYNRHMVYVSE